LWSDLNGLDAKTSFESFACILSAERSGDGKRQGGHGLQNL
jgi:hypothetical protein